MVDVVLVPVVLSVCLTLACSVTVESKKLAVSLKREEGVLEDLI